MGGGKGNIDHYVTPIRSRRIIIEVAGHCEYTEVIFCFKIIELVIEIIVVRKYYKS